MADTVDAEDLHEAVSFVGTLSRRLAVPHRGKVMALMRLTNARGAGRKHIRDMLHERQQFRMVPQ